MATEAQLLAGLKAADAAGNAADAQHFAEQIKALRASQVAPTGQQADTYTNPTPSNRIDAFIRAVTQGLMLNLGDEANAAKNASIPLLVQDKSLVSQAPSWYQRYQENLRHERGLEKSNTKEYPVTTAAGNVAGAIPLGTMLAPARTWQQAAAQGGRIGAA